MSSTGVPVFRRMLYRPEPWTKSAECVQSDPELWFSEDPRRLGVAKAICGRCEVRNACLEAALREESAPGNFAHGIRGGLTAKDRDRLRRSA